MLDPHIRQMLDAAAAAGAPDFSQLPPVACRVLYSQILAATSPALAEGVTIHSRRITGPAGELRVRVYQPGQAASGRGAVLYLHGGGFVLGCADDYDGVCSQLCARADCVVAQVEYRLAPEHPFPAAVDDCYAALGWLAEHAAELGADPSRLAVCGDSAGANLSAVMALLARDRQGPALACQALVYPVTERTPQDNESYRHYGRGYALSTKAGWYFTELYRGTREPDHDFRAAPLHAPSHADLPPALVLLAGCDMLRDEGRAYAAKLRAAEVPVELHEYACLPHGFLSMAGAFASADQALQQLAESLGRTLNS